MHKDFDVVSFYINKTATLQFRTLSTNTNKITIQGNILYVLYLLLIISIVSIGEKNTFIYVMNGGYLS